MADVVHMLRFGGAICGKVGTPSEWGPGHKWVATDHDEHGPRSAANCPGCLTVRSASNREAWGVPDVEQDWFFTFGSGHHYPGKPEQPLGLSFVRFRGTYMSARMQMIEVFGGKWAFQYESAQAAGVDEHGLTEVHPLVGPVTEKLHAPPGGAHAVPTHRGVSWLAARHIDDLLGAVLAWRAQGRKSKWTTPASRHLADVADRLRERYPDLCEALTAEPVEERPPCPGCQQPMARYAGPGTDRGWTCVTCEPNPA
jgi:hypothetical protein